MTKSPDNPNNIKPIATNHEPRPSTLSRGSTNVIAMTGLPKNIQSMDCTQRQLTLHTRLNTISQLGCFRTEKSTVYFNAPVRDDNGDIVRWEGDVKVNRYKIAVPEKITNEIAETLDFAAKTANIDFIQRMIEQLSMIKPLENSTIKRSVFLATLANDLLESGVGDYATGVTCKHFRQSTEHVFFPPFAEFLEFAIIQQSDLQTMADLAQEALTKKITTPDADSQHEPKPESKSEKVPFPETMPESWREIAEHLDDPEAIFLAFKEKMKGQLSSRWDESWNVRVLMHTSIKTF